MAKTPKDHALLLAADWLEEAEFDEVELRTACNEVAAWIRAKAFDAKLARLAKHVGKSVPRVRAIIDRNSKLHHMTPSVLLDTYCEEKGIK